MHRRKCSKHSPPLYTYAHISMYATPTSAYRHSTHIQKACTCTRPHCTAPPDRTGKARPDPHICKSLTVVPTSAIAIAVTEQILARLSSLSCLMLNT